MKVCGPAFLFERLSSGETLKSFDRAYEIVQADLTREARDNALFAAHLEMLEDPMLKEGVKGLVSEGLSERDALTAACVQICTMFSEIDDEYLKARVDDVRDVCARLERAMCGDSDDVIDVPDGSILVAEELFPSDTARLDFSRIRGILCHRGSATSHVCIIAHSKAVPINVGVGIEGIRNGDQVEVDDPMVGESVSGKIRAAGRKLYVNAGTLDQVKTAIEADADGIGLFRTELLFLSGAEMPTFEEQREIYREAILMCSGKPLTFRTLDIGGDKRLPWLPLPEEDNPFLGLRGIRLCLKYPDILSTQLSAIVSAAVQVRSEHPDWFEGRPSPVRVMFPMVDTVEEIRSAKGLVTCPEGLVQFGIMIETPAAVLNIDSMAEECNFFSLGTNDLTQYIMAADRGNAEVAHLYDSLCPAMLTAIGMAVRAAHAAGIHTGICGEMASDPRATDILLEIGVDSFSVSKI